MQALIYDAVTLAALIQHAVGPAPPSPATAIIVPSDPATLIIVCCTRKVFQAHLLQSILAASPRKTAEQTEVRNNRDATSTTAHSADRPTDVHAALSTDTNTALHAPADGPKSPQHMLLRQPLSTLCASAAVKVAFCDSAPVLYAYLATLAAASPAPVRQSESEAAAAGDANTAAADEMDVSRRLVLVNPIAMHRGSTSYSAQGISRTLAAAIETAWRVGRALIVVETVDTPPRNSLSHDFEGHEDAVQIAAETVAHNTPMAAGDFQQATEPGLADREIVTPVDPWNAEIPIVNSTTKSFGSAEGRAQLARKTTARAVAARWFHFRALP